MDTHMLGMVAFALVLASPCKGQVSKDCEPDQNTAVLNLPKLTATQPIFTGNGITPQLERRGGRIVYVRGPYPGAVIVKDGDTEKTLVSDTGDARYTAPQWSPTGKYILLHGSGAVSSGGTGGGWIEIRDATNGALVQKLPGGTAAWFPDDSRVAVASASDQKLVVASVPDGKTTDLGHVRFARGMKVQLSVSPDSSQIAMVDVPGFRQSALTTVDVKTGARRELLKDLGTGERVAPFWSPDGAVLGAQVIGFAAPQPTPGTSKILLWSLEKSSEAPAEIYSNTLADPDQIPTFSPAGDRVAFVSRTGTAAGGGGASQLRTVRSDGTDMTEVLPVEEARPGQLRWVADRVIIEDTESIVSWPSQPIQSP